MQALQDNSRNRMINLVRYFEDFNNDNDPYWEHDFGSIEFDKIKTFFKIDYYDKDKKYGSQDPSNPSVTSRVMTIMLAEEY